ncbi:hypothetical protein C8R45DRAFT_599616 [Mycena sanguinolenta]|nr:hypothetical protein C8R45DRAFT_599616 [Mycena sanguinolenta]
MEDLHWLLPTKVMINPNSTRATAFSMLVNLTVDSVYGDACPYGAVATASCCFLLHCEQCGPRFSRNTGLRRVRSLFQRTRSTIPRLPSASVSRCQTRPVSTSPTWATHAYRAPTVLSCHNRSDQDHPVSESCLATDDNTHAHLQRMVFRAHSDYRLKQPNRARFGRFMATLRTTTSFPALREIQNPLRIWPTKESVSSTPHSALYIDLIL